MQRIALLILCLAAISCDKKVVSSVDVPVEEAFTEEALTEDVLANAGLVCSGSLQLPTGAALLAEDLQVLSSFGEVTPNAAGDFNISMADSRKPQFVFAIDPATDNSLLLGYMDPLQNEQVHLSCESTAVGLAFLTPLMIGTTAEQRSEFINGIKTHPKFSLLVEAVEATLQADPQNVLNYTAHPELYEQAGEISVDVWQQMTAAGKLLALKSGAPWIEGGPGNIIYFVNPTYAYYAARISTADQSSEVVTVSPTPGAANFNLLNIGRALRDRSLEPIREPPVRTDHPLDDGHFEVYLTKGFSKINIFDGSADGQASLANIKHFISLIFEIGGEIADIAGFLDPASLDEQISGTIKAVKDGDILAVFTGLIGIIDDQIDEDGNLKFNNKKINPKTMKVLSVLKGTTKVLGIISTGEKFLNKGVPFVLSLILDQREVQYELIHNRAQITALRSQEIGDELTGSAVEGEKTFTLPKGAQMEMVWIPGKDSGEFWLGKYEVTQGQWEAVMGTKPWAGEDPVREDPADPGTRVGKGPAYPAVNISWVDVHKFIGELNDVAGDSLYRLPTEEEWEYACRAGTETGWSFGDEESELTHYAWYGRNSRFGTHETRDPQKAVLMDWHSHRVGGKFPNPWGLHDMHGNVAEWVQNKGVERGGSFVNEPEDVMSTSRFEYLPTEGSIDVGFRLLRVEVPEPLWEEETFELLGDAEMTMVRIEPGTFRMGSIHGDSNAEPVHEVEITKGFWLGTHEVTQGQWYEVMGTTPWAGQGWALADSIARHPSYPATYISWEDVQEFIARLNAAEGARWYRLPSEAEWEYACRAGTRTQWWFGNNARDLTYYGWSWSADSPTAYPQMVNLKRPNPWGLRDMHGNVAEWVQDWYDPGYYHFSPPADPQGPSWPFLDSAPRRVVRGGSVFNVESLTRSASRGRYAPDTRNAYIGFRLIRLDEPEALPEPVAAPREQTFYPGGEGMEMMWIEPGAFEMGSSDYPNASPHEVEISTGFWLGTHEVTQGQWDAVMGGTDWAAPWVGQSHVQLNAEYPATYVSWEDVQEFIARLNDEEGGRYYRLPTEAEWEYACRAGTTTRWSFGDDEHHLEYFAWYEENARDNAPRSPTLKRANAWGLRGMHGNVAEWVQDWYDKDYYANSPVMDPQGPLWPPFDAVHHRVTRGGGFNTYPAFTQSAFRWIAPPGSGSPFIGFRLVRDATPQEPTRTVSLPAGASMGFARVEPGVFQMGSDDGDPNEKPVHEVEISKGFWLGQYEVTKAQWEAVMEPPSKYQTRWAALSESHPAIGISWNAAQEFIEALNTAAGERRYRLPTEAEWEYACRAGMPTRWSFGDDVRRLEHYAWYRDNASGVNEVGQKRPNFWGLYDMHGNVQEWVQDRYGEGYYAESPVMDPAGPATGNARVRRGGIYNNRAESVRSARREGSNPSNEDVSFGFRLVMLDRPEPLEVGGGGALGEELLALTSTLLVSVLDLFSIALLAFGLDEEVPVDGLGGGTVVLAGSNWTLQDYSPDGSLIINGSLVVDMTLFPAVPISGELTISGSIESTVVLDLLLDLETAALIGMITIDGENFDMADIIAAAEGREVLPEEEPEEEPIEGGGAMGEESTFSLPGGAEMEFVWIEPGVFQMGATESEINETIDWCTDLGYSRRACVDLYGAEGPLHEVEISQGFYLGKYEITKSQWLEVMTPIRTPWSSDATFATFSGLESATDISWYDVQEFVDLLNDAAGDSLYRLPTEAEWEYACRAGTSTRWSSGDDERELRHYAWYGDNASGVNEVGLKRPNAWGLYDMHGNVWEWVQDWYDADYYNSSPRVDPPGPSSGAARVIRGGFFSVGTQDLRSAQRSYGSPSSRRDFLGARLVRIR